jgi:hypothetical protein
MPRRGWKNEPARHALASRGVRTKTVKFKDRVDEHFMTKKFKIPVSKLNSVAAGVEKGVQKSLRRAKVERHDRDEAKESDEEGVANYHEGTMEMYEQDAKDLQKIARLVRKGKLEQALDKIDNLDTAVRDEIPNSFWRLPGIMALYDGPEEG